jgi:hypothetical protein
MEQSLDTMPTRPKLKYNVDSPPNKLLILPRTQGYELEMVILSVTPQLEDILKKFKFKKIIVLKYLT